MMKKIVLHAFVFAGCMKTNVHSGNIFRSRFRLFVFLCNFVSRNSYLHLQYTCTESEDSSCSPKRSFSTSPFSYCFINPRIFSVNRELKESTTATARKTSIKKLFYILPTNFAIP